MPSPRQYARATRDAIARQRPFRNRAPSTGQHRATRHARRGHESGRTNGASCSADDCAKELTRPATAPPVCVAVAMTPAADPSDRQHRQRPNASVRGDSKPGGFSPRTDRGKQAVLLPWQPRQQPVRTSASAPPTREDALFVSRRRRSAQPAFAVDDAVAIRMADGLDQMPSVSAVASFGLRRGARGEVPFNAVAFATRGNLAARPNDRPPERAFRWRRGRFGFRLARGPLAAHLRGRFDRGCSHGVNGTSLDPGSGCPQ